MTTSAVIVTTYNRPDALHRVLAALAKQSHRPDEVIVADDGSGPETAQCVGFWQNHGRFPLKHIWQPDCGFRAAAARNQAICRSSADYLIFLDGDCIVFSDFLRRHLELSEPGWFLVGNRILLNQAMTLRIIEGREDLLRWTVWQWLVAKLRGDINRLVPLLRISGDAWRKLRRRRWQGARTCNLGVWRKDALAVNGFDERYQGWGHEDADLIVRLLHLGCRRKDGQFAVPVVHLWHEESNRSKEQQNKSRLKQVIEDVSATKALRGIAQYIDERGPVNMTKGNRIGPRDHP